ncbi:C-5 cytosine methyltransferase [Penicillium alfredii]|uniref:C-5 cytosine methyltransferase n=1 Tax=Penicillium alfredii TaxID=1506179 RepID=A0A9W9ELU6_9EURO|nr:C-5 cytosine methyltransferase [Penicillium alfredii]KAJ5084094.1 C-5 cytosine methyltransferase [Penicillium alfredii]
MPGTRKENRVKKGLEQATASQEPAWDEIPELVRSAPLGPNRYFDWELPPLHKLEDIFKDLADKALTQGFADVLSHLGQRPLRVATMCSGTESPLLALEMIQRALGPGLDLRISHLFSCEIVPFKQAYIERNFRPPIIFRDILELGCDEARTAYGSLEAVPGKLDILVAGTACVDFSLLNNSKKSIEECGESGGTFRGLLRYAEKYRPRLIVQENVRSAPWNQFAEYWQSIGYFSVFAALDTKSFYIPQTRERGYMICIDISRLQHVGMFKDPKSDVDAKMLSKQLLGVINGFKRTASSPAGMFLLGEENRRLEQVEKDLSIRGEIASDRAEISWDRYQVRHQRHRDELELGNERPISRSQSYNVCRPPDFYWKGYFKTQCERVWETLDIFFLKMLAQGFDMSFKERWVDLSQGVDRSNSGKGSSAFGVAGCLTPHGMPFVTTRGGPLCGIEALALQGLPLDRMLLTRETHSNHQDLAGNAMTSTVVGAVMLAALIVGQKVLDKGTESIELQETLTAAQSLVQKKDSHTLVNSNIEIAQVCTVDQDQLRAKAVSSARCCICERQTGVKADIVECILCGYTGCSTCSGNPSHSFQPSEISRTPPLDFIVCLKGLLPMQLKLSGISGEVIDGLKEHLPKNTCLGNFWDQYVEVFTLALSDQIRFVDINRAEHWKAEYEGRHSILRLDISADRLQWLFFAKPPPTAPSRSLIREALSKPVARMTPIPGSLIDGKWEVGSPISVMFTLQTSGTGTQVRSFQSECGLQEAELRDSQVWSHLCVGAADEDIQHLDLDIRGLYTLLPDCGTALGTLYKKEATDSSSAVYLFLDPTKIGHPDKDSCVFSLEHSRIPGYARRMTIVEFSYKWRALKVTSTSTNVDAFYRPWYKAPEAKLSPYAGSEVTYRSLKAGTCVSIGAKDCHDTCISLISLSASAATFNLPDNPSPWQELDPVSCATALKDLAWLAPKISSWSPFQGWNEIDIASVSPHGDGLICGMCYPPMPKVIWGRDKRGRIVPYEDPKGAATFERAVKHKPIPFVVFRQVNENGIGEYHIMLNVQSLVHQAYGKLVGNMKSGGPAVFWRLIPNAYDMERQERSGFTLLNNKSDTPSRQPPHFRQPLRNEQLRSLAWMMSQEAEDIEPFVEEETEEAVLPLMPWRAEAKVTMPKTIRGGVLADEVGYGKTAIILALIDAQFESDKSRQAAPDDTELIPSNATLIVVPGNVFSQWDSEIGKFLDDQYHVLCIGTHAKLANTSIHEIQTADIILLSWAILKSPSYYSAMQHFTGTPRAPEKAGRNFDNWFQDAHSSLKDRVNKLRKEGPEAFLRDVRARRLHLKEDQANLTYVPSQRLRGQAYTLANQGREEAGFRESSGTQTSATDEETKPDDAEPVLDDAETEYDDSDTENHGSRRNGKRKCGQQEAKGTRPKWNDRQTFNIHQSNESQDWRTVKHPILHAFKFNRLVIDEYTYSGEEKQISFLYLAARSKWILSGTPALAEFADVKSIARYLDAHLGIDDDGDAPTQNTRLKFIRKNHTAVEAFQLFQPPHSNAWYDNRHRHAQSFLNRFARQNMAEIDHIPLDTHLVLSQMSSAEQKAYVMLYSRLVAQKGQRRKINNPDDDPQISGLNEILTSSQSAHETLVKCCTATRLKDVPWSSDKCESQIATQKRICSDLWNKLEILFRQAVVVWSQCNTYSWQATEILDGVFVTEFGGPDTVKRATTLIETCYSSCREWIEAEEYRDIMTKVDARFTKVTKTAAIANTKKAQAKTTKSKSKETEPRQPSRKRVKQSAESPTKDDHSELQAKAEKTVKKALLTEMSHSIKELVKTERDIRFFQTMRDFQKTTKTPECEGCKDTPSNKSELRVIRSCGHIHCLNCIERTALNNECLTRGCTGSTVPSKLIPCVDGERNGIGSSKINKLVEIIQQTPVDELVLLFIQFAELEVIASQALTAAKIEHRVSKSRNTNAIRDFIEPKSTKKGGQPSRPKVLILRLGSSMAAGLNLQCANHVIFLSPLLKATQYEWESGMTQAIGRVRRYGQKRHVHVYHLLAKHAADVNIFQERHGQILVERDGEPVMVSPEEVSGNDVVRCQGEPLDFEQ